jgi:hypothetical protein
MSYTTGQTILLPEATAKRRGQRTVTVAINSRDRNLAINPYSNDFRWNLRRPLKDIVSIELLSGCLPADLYNVNTGWNQFTFGEGIIRRVLTLTPGQYTADALASELQIQLGTIGGSNTYTVAHSAITKKITVTAVGPDTFTFYFASGDYVDVIEMATMSITSINSPAHLLGFTKLDYTGSAASALVSPNRADPDYCIKRMYLHINVDNSVELNRVEMGVGRHECFHIIFMDSTQKDGYYFLNKDTYLPIYYSSPAPIARMAFFYISLRDEFFRLIDLGNHDFTLVFEITVLG